MKIACFLFGCAYDPVDDSSAFECFRCCAIPDTEQWCWGVKWTRAIYRWCMGWHVRRLEMTETVKRPTMRHPPCAVECRCDGNQVYALIGEDYVTGVVGFGDTLADALRALADEIEREVEVTESSSGS